MTPRLIIILHCLDVHFLTESFQSQISFQILLQSQNYPEYGYHRPSFQAVLQLMPYLYHVLFLLLENEPADHVYDITGSLCENNDKFAIDRKLPKIDMGDLLVIHDTGAHGFAMGYNYNGKLKSAEILLKEDGTTEKIRRAETPDDYFATIKGFNF